MLLSMIVCTLLGDKLLNDAVCYAGTLYTTVQLATTGCHVPVNLVVQAVADVLVSCNDLNLLGQYPDTPNTGV